MMYSAVGALWCLLLASTVVHMVGAAAGETVCIEGNIMDQYCIDDTFLLDSGLPTLEKAFEHTIHCLVDVSVCRNGKYNILRDPATPGGLYSVAYTVDDAGKQTLIKLARAAGNPSLGCYTCDSNGGSLQRGFRAEVRGVDLGNGILQVVSARTSNGLSPSDICVAANEPPPTSSPPPPPTSSPPSDDFWSNLFCFSGTSTVQVRNHGIKRMDELKIGEEVLVQEGNGGKFSKVYSFGHWDPSVTIEYLQFWTNGTGDFSGAEISASHLVHVIPFDDAQRKRTVRPAGAIRKGDCLVTSRGDAVYVNGIHKVWHSGAYAPFTESGDIVVNGIVASNYIALPTSLQMKLSFAQQHWVQHAACAPYRLFCRWIGCESESYNEATGFSKAASIGLDILGWAEGQNVIVQDVLLYVVAIPGLRLVLALEQLMDPWMWHVLAAVFAVIVWRKGVHKKL